MIDLKRIRDSKDEVEAALKKRMDQVDLQPILDLDAEKRSRMGEADEKRRTRKELGKQVGALRAKGEQDPELEARAAALRDEIAAAEARVEEISASLSELMDALPNLPDERVPAGGKENNQVVKVHGDKPQLEGQPKDHVDLCTGLGLVDYERGTKLAGSGSWIYTGRGAALEWALINFFCKEHYADGYTFMLPPHMLVHECGYAAGQFPKFKDDVYHLQAAEGERERFLLPTSETAILNVYRDEVVPTTSCR